MRPNKDSKADNRTNDQLGDKTVIGITGGVGAGKSTVLSYITEHFDSSVIMADEVGRQLMQPGHTVYEALVENYGTGILREDGSIDTGRLASIVFVDEAAQQRINEIEHPLIHDEICRLIEASGKSLVFVEAALLKEGGLDRLCDEIWYITASEEIRIARLMENRGYTEEKCRRILRLQLKDEEFRAFCTKVINNGASFSETAEQIDRAIANAGKKKERPKQENMQ